MKSINSLSLEKDIINKLKDININYIEELWQLKRSDLKSNNFNNEEINKIIISLQLIGLDLNKKKY
jgi:DNA-directed RNA polymerase alpha subunit